MKKLTIIVQGVFLTSTLLAAAQERKLTYSQLPPAVASTVDRATKGSTVKGFSTEREHGRKVYEAETTLDGHTRDLQIAADGTLSEVEEEVGMDALPASVRAALTKKAAGAQIKKVESLTKGGKLVAYEASVIRKGKKGEFQVGPNGESLSHSE